MLKKEDKVSSEERTSVTYEEAPYTDLTGGTNPSRTNETETGIEQEKEVKKFKKSKTRSSLNFEIRMITTRAVEEGEELCFDYGPLYSPSNGWTL